MASPFDLTSFPGFKSFGIERYDTCDDDGGGFALQMSPKRSREGGPYDVMLACLLDGAKLLLADEEDEEYDTSRSQGPGRTKTKQRRKSYSKLARWDITDDSRIWMVPKYSYWYKCFIEYPDRDNPRFLKKFRLKFRIPLHNFEELAVSLEDEAVFRHWHCNHHGKAERLRSAPIPLLLLTSLQYMGRALTLDDFEELCWTDGDVIRVFLHVFLKVGRTDLYESYI